MRILPLAHLAVEVSWQAPDWEFMQPMPRLRHEEHPLVQRPEYSHFRRTTLTLPPWTVRVAPRWLLRKEALGEEGIYARYALRYRSVEEPPGSERIERQPNQEELVDSFFSAIRPGESLIFLYCRDAPFATEGAAILAGIGRVEDLGAPECYDLADPQDWPSLLPYRAVEHSIRPTAIDGFLFPLERFLDDPQEDLLCKTPAEIGLSGGASLLDHDGAWALLAAAQGSWRRILKKYAGRAPLSWIEGEKLRVKDLRGNAPGAASVLRALGLRQGPAVVAELDREPGTLWSRVEGALRNPAELGGLLPPGVGAAWQILPTERRALFKLLALFSLSPAQANRLFNQRTEPTDAELLADPYRLPGLPLPLVDRGMVWEAEPPFEEDERTDPGGVVSIGSSYSDVASPLDPRRIRALMRMLLEQAAERGSTLLSLQQLVEEAEKVELDPPCPLSLELLLATPLEDLSDDGLVMVELSDESPALQLQRLARYGAVIRKAISSRRRRLDASPPPPPAPALVDVSTLDEATRERLGAQQSSPPTAAPVVALPEEGEEDGARVISFAARKAARRPEPPPPEPVVEVESPRIGFKSGWPRPRNSPAEPPPANTPPVPPADTPPVPLADAPQNEASRPPRRKPDGPPDWKALVSGMEFPEGLRDRALAEREAALEGIWASRFSLLVAPAGTGVEALLRLWIQEVPTVVLVPHAALRSAARESLGVEECYALEELPRRREAWKNVVLLHASMLSERELARLCHATRPVRRLVLVGDPALPLPAGPGCPFVDLQQKLAPTSSVFPKVSENYAELSIRSEPEASLRVADWFSGRSLSAGAAAAREVPAHHGVRFVRWNTHQDLWEKILENMNIALELEGAVDTELFQARFQAMAAPGFWQMLAPQRGGELGVDDLNRRIQEHFRSAPLSEGALRAVGPQRLRPGDRVVVWRGGPRVDVSPSAGAAPLVAGDLGLLVGQLSGEQRPWKLEARFGDCSRCYGFMPEEFTEEDPPLMLGWALSVRWAQRIRCKHCFLVVPEAGQLTREMVVAAIGCGTERVVIFHPGLADELFRDEYPDLSDRGRRCTNLFRAPGLSGLPIPGRPGAERTIAEALLEEGVDFLYQAPLEGPDGATRWPAFRFEDQAGRVIWWEHLAAPRTEADLQARAEMEAWYAELEIFPESVTPWGGPGGILVVTDDEGDWEESLKRILIQVEGDAT